MGRSRRQCWLVWVWAFFALALASPARVRAQQFDATNLHEPTPLATGWLIHGGDDPAYARPDFDDSKWTPVDTKMQSPRDVLDGQHPQIIWYRLHLKVPTTESGLALEEVRLANAFEIYANGKVLLRTGSLEPYSPSTYAAGLVHPIPAADISSGTLVLAVRLYISKSDWSGTFPGLYYNNLVLGQEHELKQGILLSLLNTTAIPWVNGLFGVGLGLVSLMLYLAQRDRREYLWIFLYTLVVLNVMSWRTFTLTHNIPMAWLTLGILVYTPMLILLFVLYFAFLRLRMGRWIWISLGAAITLQAAGFYGLYILHLTTQALLLVVQLPVNILTTVVLPVLLIVQWRKGNREAGILLIPALFSSVATYVSVGFTVLMLFPGTFAFGDRMFLLIFSFQVGPFTVSLYDVGDFLFNLSLTVIVVLRATKASREQALFEGELAAARGVQQVIVPEHVESIPGFTVESAYLPAQQVGGDFFQVLPVKDGGLLVVVGDVAGKGLPAAMLVSVMVGAIRGVVAFTTDPAELLANLNDRLVGRVQGGFATALVARIDPDGRIAIANAGHPSPYLNGVELELAGALPLGIESGARYEVFHSSIPPGARLTFYSDGVIEAMDGKGEMFGFERAQAISTERAGAILERTVGFGQQDDITVITIDRMPAIAAAA